MTQAMPADNAGSRESFRFFYFIGNFDFGGNKN